MATLKRLVKKTSDILQFRERDEDILDYLNDALLVVANMEDPLILLPGLMTTDTVSTSTSLPYVALPSDYLRHLYHIESADEEDANIEVVQDLGSLEKMYGTLTSNTGRVEAVTIAGDNLYYQNIPSTSDTLTLSYYKEPTLFDISDSSEITIIPNFLQEDILVAYALHKLFNIIGDETAIAKSAYYYKVWKSALETLHKYLRHSPKQTRYINRPKLFF